MTVRRSRARAGFVRTFLPFLTCLMLVFTGFSSMAHASETVNGSFAGIEFTAHSAGDSDEVPSDADKNVPHHHNNCHGHCVGEPARTAFSEAQVLMSPKPMAKPAGLLDGRDNMVHLRPPQA